MAVEDKYRMIDELCSEASKKSDGKLMHVLRAVLRSVAARNEAIAADILQDVETMCYDNGLKRHECMEICAKMVGQDGSRGGRWTSEQVSAYLKKSGLPECEAPRYNMHALTCAMNMMYADHTEMINEIAGDGTGHTVEGLCHRLAVDVLKDDDGVFDIRRYFKLDGC